MSTLQQLHQKFQRALGEHEQASRNAQLSKPPHRLDVQVIAVLIAACVVLSLLNYYGGSGDWSALEPLYGLWFDDPNAVLRQFFHHDEFGRLIRLGYWSGTTFVGYFLFPVILVVWVFKKRLSDFGLPSPAKRSHFGICLGLFAVMLPFVLVASFTDGFQSTYPFYEHADRSILDFVLWQLVYAAQFFALEFFYRGFLIHGIKHRFGVYSILVSTIPYVMIHFGKPLPETLGSIVAGLALGALSYHLRTIWPGVFLHIAIALSMDVFSLSAQGKIGLF